MSEVTRKADLVSISIWVVCPCGEATAHEIEVSADVHGGWSVPTEERFILCDGCGDLIDAGLSIEVKT